MNFFRISRQIPEKSDACRFSVKFAKTISKIIIAEIFETSPKRRLAASLRGAAAGGLKEFAVRR